MTIDHMNYPGLIDTAMRSVVYRILKSVEANGLPGEHHFYITFATQHPGVSVSAALRERYPEEMTVVLQHQFWDFNVEDDVFEVSLSFGGAPEKLVIPYTSLTSFADPSLKFGLQFERINLDEEQLFREATIAQMHQALPFDDSLFDEVEEDQANDSAEIISLDAFRKK